MDFDYSKPHKIVNGEPVLLTAAEIAECDERNAEWENGAVKRAVIEKIAELEASITDRMWREDAVGSTAVISLADTNDPRHGKTASQYIYWVNQQIAQLRR